MLRARISQCLRYIQNQFEKGASLFGSGESSAGKEHEAEGTKYPPPIQLSDASPSPSEVVTVADKPQPIAVFSGNRASFYYRCSDCSRIFLLPEDQPAKEAARELFLCFREHIEQDHLKVASAGDQQEPRPAEA
jgi:hypothetical protein